MKFFLAASVILNILLSLMCGYLMGQKKIGDDTRRSSGPGEKDMTRRFFDELDKPPGTKKEKR